MTVFIQNIPKNTTKADIRNFFNPALNKFRFIQIGKILKIEIFDSLNKVTGEIQYHAIVYLDSEKTVQRAIKKLHAQQFKNRTITVRKYFYRSWHNDPRNNNYDVSDEIKNRRVADRRHNPYSAIGSLHNFSTEEQVSAQSDGITLLELVAPQKNEAEDKVNFSNLQSLLAQHGIAVRIHDNSLIFTTSYRSIDNLITQMTKAFTTQIDVD